MATLPLAVGSIGACEWEGMGSMLLRDNQGNGNLIWVSQYANLDIRVSTDDGATWTEPTALGAEGVYGSTWAQDSEGNLHGVLPNGINNAKYRKVTLTRTAGDITSAAETTTLTLACITTSALGRSWSIAVVSDGQATPVERVAIAWIDGKFSGSGASQRLSIRCVVTTEAAGVSPTAATDFKAFDESTATGELIRNDAGSSTGTDLAFYTKIAQMPGTAGDAKWRLYVAVRALDATNVSERFIKVYHAAWNNVASQPFWGAFAELATGSSPLETAIHNIDLLADAANNRIIFCGMDTTSTTAKTLDIWTIDTTGALDKNVTFAQVSFPSLSNPGRSGKLALDQNGQLWAFMIANMIGWVIGVAYYSGGWVVNYQHSDIIVAIEDIVVTRTNNQGNRMFYACAFDHADADPCVMSVALSAESKTVKTSGGDYDDFAAACLHAPDLCLYDHTLTVSYKAGGWSAIELGQSVTAGNNAQRTILSGATFLVQSAVADRHAGLWDTAKVYITTSTVSACSISNPFGPGTIKVIGIQFEETGTFTAMYFAVAMGNSTGSVVVEVNKCLLRHTPATLGNGVVTLGGSSVDNATFRIVNCTVWQTNVNTGTACIYINKGNAAEDYRVLSCSAYDASTSIDANGFQNNDAALAAVFENCVVEMATVTSDRAFVDGGGGWGTSNYNAAGGAAASNDAPGANSLSDLTAAQIGYVDKANGDLHIDRATSSLVEVGTDLSSIFTDDIDGETRVLPWDIGADETFAAVTSALGAAYINWSPVMCFGAVRGM